MAQKQVKAEDDGSGRHPVVQRALAFFKDVSAAEAEQRRKELEDLEFEAGEHWDARIKADRLAAGKPVLEIDLLSGPLNQIEGQANEAKAGIVLSANKPGTMPKVAEKLQGFARNIEQQSIAHDVYLHATRRVARAGRGGWRILPELESPEDGPDQVLRIKWIDNWFQVYLGPAKEQDGSDRRQALIVEDLTLDQYVERFGESSVAETLNDLQSIGDAPLDWLTKNRVRIAEYFEIKETKKDYGLVNGEKVDLSTLQKQGKGKQATYLDEFGQPVELAARWSASEKTCCWYLINAIEVLDEREWKIPFIPIIEIEGERRNLDGKIDRRGIVRMGKQLNQMADYHETALVEQVDVGRQAPWLTEWESIEEFEEIWKNPKTQVRLPYRAYSKDGMRQLPIPQRITSETPIQATVVAAQRAEQLLRNVTGVPDVFASETEGTKETSGRAILARQRQQEIGNSKYLVARNRGIAYTGRVLLAWMAAIYDTPRVHRITGETDQDEVLLTYSGEEQKPEALMLAQQLGIDPDAVVDLKAAAKYDVAVTVGKPYATQRMETVEIINSAVQAFPPLAPKALPILFKHSDGPGMRELAAVLEAEQRPDVVPAEEHARLKQEAQKVIEAAKQKIAELEDQVKSKRDELTAKVEIERYKADRQIDVERVKADAEIAKADILARRPQVVSAPNASPEFQ